MVLRKISIRTEELGAEFSLHGVSVQHDWRYEVLMDYLYASHSFQAVLMHKQGKEAPYNLPTDYAVIEAVVNDFGDFRKIGERRWWDVIGRHLFGIKSPLPEARLLGELRSETPSLTHKWTGIDAAIIEIPFNLSPSVAIRQFKKLLSSLELSVPLNSSQLAPKYHLRTNRLRRDTLILGATALKRYNHGWPLWKIGNYLRLIPTLSFDEQDAEKSPHLYIDNKKALATVARRLVSFAALVAENAARGRFLTNASFPEAMLTSYHRPAGRPKGSTRKK